jgi:hypothetical protein
MVAACCQINPRSLREEEIDVEGMASCVARVLMGFVYIAERSAGSSKRLADRYCALTAARLGSQMEHELRLGKLNRHALCEVGDAVAQGLRDRAAVVVEAREGPARIQDQADRLINSGDPDLTTRRVEMSL